MPRPSGTIGETKLKILAIIHHNQSNGSPSYGYCIWRTLKTYFHCYFDHLSLRNVYRHLNDLSELELIDKEVDRSNNEGPERYLYSLSKKGRDMENRFIKYVEILDE